MPPPASAVAGDSLRRIYTEESEMRAGFRAFGRLAPWLLLGCEYLALGFLGTAVGVFVANECRGAASALPSAVVIWILIGLGCFHAAYGLLLWPHLGDHLTAIVAVWLAGRLFRRLAAPPRWPEEKACQSPG